MGDGRPGEWLTIFSIQQQPYNQKLGDEVGRIHWDLEEKLQNCGDLRDVFASAGASQVEISFGTFSPGDVPTERRPFRLARTGKLSVKYPCALDPEEFWQDPEGWMRSRYLDAIGRTLRWLAATRRLRGPAAWDDSGLFADEV